MQKIYLINVFVVVLIAYIRTAELENTYIDSWDAEKDWTSHFEPCRSHFMFTFSPCDPNTKMLACCRRFSPFLLFILLVFSLTSIAAVLILMLCCICPPWRVLCECFLCCSWCAIDENGNFIHFAEEEDENPEEFDIRTEDAFTTTSMTETLSKK